MGTQTKLIEKAFLKKNNEMANRLLNPRTSAKTKHKFTGCIEKTK